MLRRPMARNRLYYGRASGLAASRACVRSASFRDSGRLRHCLPSGATARILMMISGTVGTAKTSINPTADLGQTGYQGQVNGISER